jgi:hypothetical protein
VRVASHVTFFVFEKSGKQLVFRLAVAPRPGARGAMSGALARLRRERAVFASERAGVGGADSFLNEEARPAALLAAVPSSSEASWRGAGVARSWEALPKRSRVSAPDDANKPHSRDPTLPARRGGGDASGAARALPPAQHHRHAPPPPLSPLSGAITDLLDGFECAPAPHARQRSAADAARACFPRTDSCGKGFETCLANTRADPPGPPGCVPQGAAARR